MILLPSTRPRRHRDGHVLVASLAATLALLLLAGCGGSGAAADPATALKTAKQKFDSASSIHFSMSTASQPSGGDAVLGADGVLTHQPAFKGSVKVLFSGFNADIPVVSVDGKVYAKLPLTPKYAEIDPSEYGAPDPAVFADPDRGISGLLLKLKDATSTGSTREGKAVLQTYSGTLDGSLVAPIIPSADAGGSYQAVVGIDDQGRMVTLHVTGSFFPGNDAVSYDLVFDDYDGGVTVEAP